MFGMARKRKEKAPVGFIMRIDPVANWAHAVNIFRHFRYNEDNRIHNSAGPIPTLKTCYIDPDYSIGAKDHKWPAPIEIPFTLHPGHTLDDAKKEIPRVLKHTLALREVTYLETYDV